ncbi:MAG: Gfo/Idh/MocA family protein [Planctomycetota bacterium]|jgi:predicted dehydrogenase
MLQEKQIDRRVFLSKSAGIAASAIGFPYFVFSSALGKAGSVAPSNRIALGFIGTGGRGRFNMRAFMAEPDVRVVSVCDVDTSHRERARNEAALLPDAAYNDFRDLLERKDIDAVVISTPDHWHVPTAAAAVRAGKDIFCEKPLTLTVGEGRVLCDLVRQYARVFQTGSQQRSDGGFQLACELVRTGRIGKLKVIKVGLPGSRSIGPQPVMPVPEGFNYDMWLGAAPWKPYTKARCHGKFRHIFDYSGGKFIDWGTHHLDIVQLALGMDDSGPVEVAGRGEFPTEGIYDTAVTYDVWLTYANGVTVFEGTEGWVFVNRGVLEAHPKSLLKEARRGSYDSHIRNFLNCVKLREDPIAPAEVGHRSSTICHLGNIAMLLGRRLSWDPRKERFVDDPAANRMTTRTMRAPWRL